MQAKESEGENLREQSRPKKMICVFNINDAGGGTSSGFWRWIFFKMIAAHHQAKYYYLPTHFILNAAVVFNALHKLWLLSTKSFFVLVILLLYGKHKTLVDKLCVVCSNNAQRFFIFYIKKTHHYYHHHRDRLLSVFYFFKQNTSSRKKL